MAQSTALERPKHWSRPSYLPLNTRPLSPSSGAYYKVLFASPLGNTRRVTANQNSTGKALFTVPWPDASRFEVDTLGYSTYVAGQSYLTRQNPLRHGDPAQQTLFLDSLEVFSQHNFDKTYHEVMTTMDGLYSDKWPKTQMLGYLATFSQRHYLIKTDAEVLSATVPELQRNVTKFPETDGFHRKVPGWGIGFDGALEEKVTTLGSIPEFQQRWIYASFGWPIASAGGQMFDSGCSIPIGYIARTLGTINDAAFDTDLILELDDGTTVPGFPIEELKYEDCRLSQPYYGADDKLYCDLYHVFLWSPKNWNKQLRPSSNAYEYVQFTTAANAAFSPVRRPFIKRNFNKLFKPRGAP